MSESQFVDQFKQYDYPLFGYVRLPVIHITHEEREKAKAKEGSSNYDFLRALTRQGFYKRIPKELHERYAARAKHELEMFDKLGFVDYVLLVWKTINYCDVNKIARDYGRGSAAGSLVFYLLEITDIDPLKYDLFFERFVSEARAKKKVFDGVTYIDGSLAPDVDIDIEQSKRSAVVEHLKFLYPDRVCKISTLATLSGKSLIKECGKILEELSEEDMKIVADMIPKKFGIVQDIEVAYEAVPKFKQWCNSHRRVYETALKLRDLIKNKGSHPSGFVVSYEKISDFLPLELVNKSGEEGKEPATSLTMEYVAQVTIKLDLLGVRCCSVVAAVLGMVGVKTSDINIDSDPLIYDNLQNLITPHGIFQLEAPTNLQVCQKIKPKNLSELSDVVAIARPGALAYLNDYSEHKDTKVHPLFDPILQSTRYVCLYQEQMMQLSAAIGFSLEEAEQLRRIVGKKKKEEMAAWEERVNEKIKTNNLPPELGIKLWKILNESADYSFNKSHSISYAALAALTTYLKFKYPLQFYTALLQESKNEPKPLEEIRKIQSELRFFGIKLLPPNLIKSEMDFKIEGENIRFGLSSIKGVSEKTIQKLSEFKHAYSNKFELFEGAHNAALSISVQSALIQSGCLDGIDPTNPTRAKLTLEAQLWNLLTGKKEKQLALEFGEKFGYSLFKVLKFMKENKNEKGKLYIIEKRWATIMKNYEPYKKIYELNSVNEALANHFYEKTLLGYSYSSKIKDVLAYIPDLMSVEEVLNGEDNDRVTFVGTVTEKVYEGVSQNEKKTRYARWTIGDETGSMTALLFNMKDENRVDACKRQNEDRLPTKDSIVVCKGTRKNDAVFLDSIRDLSIKIYTKYGDVKKDLDKKSIDSSTNSD